MVAIKDKADIQLSEVEEKIEISIYGEVVDSEKSEPASWIEL